MRIEELSLECLFMPLAFLTYRSIQTILVINLEMLTLHTYTFMDRAETNLLFILSFRLINIYFVSKNFHLRLSQIA